MAVVIRLTKTGKKGEAKFRVIVKEKRSNRDGKAIEQLGWVEKTTKGTNKEIKKDRYEYWVSKGAQPSATVLGLMKD